jgi:4-amino-4-deoxy-L-arabinose transferase-like glycosyltransferase
MAAAFSLAALLSLRWIHKGDRNQLSCAAAALGFAVMAKGAVPLVLILPVLWCGRRRWRDLLYPAVWAPFLLVAGPWYLACFLRNGQVFLDQFFWRHHVERFVSDSLQHSQPFWFYLPVLLAGIFPWIALLPLIFRAKAGALLLVAGFGFFFFSVSQNKLPEYLLPLLPSVAALMGIGLAGLETAVANRLLAATAGLAGLAPMAAGILPQALAEGITKSHFSSSIWIWFFPAVLCLAMAAFKPRFAMALVVVTAVLGVVYLEVVSLPMIDEAVSARPVWRQIKDRRDQVCIEKVHRRYRYGLNYYSVTPLPDCSSMEKPLHLAAEGGNRPVLR